MPTTHDGISCSLPPNPVRLVIGAALLAGGAWMGASRSWLMGAPVILGGALVVLNQFGSRRVRVIESKLLVEDMHLVMGLLIGPTRNRVEWDKAKAVKVEGGALRVETDGAPFVTAQGASKDDLEFLRARADAAFQKARAG